MTRPEVQGEEALTLPGLRASRPGAARRAHRRFTYEDGPRQVEVVAENVPVEVCPACGETYSGPVAWSIRDEAICRALGLLTRIPQPVPSC